MKKLTLVLLSLLACSLSAAGQPPAPVPPVREVAITFDDLPWQSVVDYQVADARRMTAELLQAIRRHRVPAIGFVNEIKLQPGGVIEAGRVAMLESWIAAGLELGNHTFSH